MFQKNVCHFSRHYPMPPARRKPITTQYILAWADDKEIKNQTYRNPQILFYEMMAVDSGTIFLNNLEIIKEDNRRLPWALLKKNLRSSSSANKQSWKAGDMVGPTHPYFELSSLTIHSILSIFFSSWVQREIVPALANAFPGYPLCYPLYPAKAYSFLSSARLARF